MEKILEELIRRYPSLEQVRDDIADAFLLLRDCFSEGGNLLVGGNGGSAADAEHIAGELMKGFCKRRPLDEEFTDALKSVDPAEGEALSQKLQMGLPVYTLTSLPALSSAYSNDVDGEYAFAQEVFGLGREGDVLLAISTSGNSKNLVHAAVAAKALGMKVMLLGGRDGGTLKALSDVSVIVPETETYKIQELHLPVYHALCLMLEDAFFDE